MENGVPIRAVSRSISVLQAINRHGSLSMMAIARQGKLPYPTAFRIVQTLIHEGLVEQEPARKRYRPTALVQSLANGYNAQSRIAEVARPHMSDFTRQMGWPLFVSVRVGTQMVVRESTHAETSLTFDLCHPGVTIPLLTSATGHALLSTIPDDELEELVTWVNRERPDTGHVELETLRRSVTEVRHNGYGARPCASSARTSSIAVPIACDEDTEAVLTMTYFNAAMKQQTAIERYATPLRVSASKIAESVRSMAVN
ncbi:IclR family transcriptional regulator domain-containing protein [Sphingomonas sp. ID0503]|uniref:IclR family transcriptional regulator domain-containing protein n=1 Tax=Sphingomonas sp. ID0503 TaxID=3399691 RepID=UPI003AFAA146